MTLENHSVFARPLAVVGGSEHSLVALRLGLELASAVGGRVTALVVREEPPPSVGIYARGDTLRRFEEQWRESARRAAEQAVRGVRRISEELGQEVVLRLAEGQVLERVAEAAKGASMVAMGRRLRGGAGEAIGRNVELLLRRVRRPLLLAPERHRRLERVVVAFAGKNLGAAALELGALAAEALGLPLEVFTAAGAARRERIQEQAMELLGPRAARAALSGRVGDPGGAIVEHCGVRDLLVMGAYGHSRPYRAVLGSVTEQVIHQLRGPLMITGRLDEERSHA
jgi:nucleotide-binding universal stress UspA family protein